MSFWCTNLGKPLSIYQISDLVYEQMKGMALVSEKLQPDVNGMMGVFNFGQGNMELHIYADPATMEGKEKLCLKLGLFSRQKITEAAPRTTIAQEDMGMRIYVKLASMDRHRELEFQAETTTVVPVVEEEL